MANGRFRLNAAAFVNDYQDLQVQSFPTVGVIDISNAASATINGIELEAAAAPGYGLQLAGHVAWLEARYDRYLAKLPGGSLLDAQDHRLNNAPRWSGRAAVVYDRRIRRASTFRCLVAEPGLLHTRQRSD